MITCRRCGARRGDLGGGMQIAETHADGCPVALREAWFALPWWKRFSFGYGFLFALGLVLIVANLATIDRQKMDGSLGFMAISVVFSLRLLFLAYPNLWKEIPE